MDEAFLVNWGATLYNFSYHSIRLISRDEILRGISPKRAQLAILKHQHIILGSQYFFIKLYDIFFPCQNLQSPHLILQPLLSITDILFWKLYQFYGHILAYINFICTLSKILCFYNLAIRTWSKHLAFWIVFPLNYGWFEKHPEYFWIL